MLIVDAFAIAQTRSCLVAKNRPTVLPPTASTENSKQHRNIIIIDPARLAHEKLARHAVATSSSASASEGAHDASFLDR